MESIHAETWAPEVFGGEHVPRTWSNFFIMHVVSWWCFLSNGLHILLLKLVSPRRSVADIAWSLGRNPKHRSQLLFDGLSHWNHQVKVNAASWQSLEPFYNYYEKIVPEHEIALEAARLESFFAHLRMKVAVKLSRYWMGHAHNRQALRNRLLITERLVEEAILSFPAEEDTRILSIAAGSGRAVFDVVEKYPERNISVTFLDRDPEAIAHAKRRSQNSPNPSRFNFVLGDTSYLNNLSEESHFHIVEMVGFLDYRSQKKAIDLSRRIRNILEDDGVYIMANIQPNSEKRLLDWALLWMMVYRTDKQFKNMLLDAGFEKKDIRIVHEPFHIHILGIARKSK